MKPNDWRVCTVSGCPELVLGGGRCPGCRRDADRRRGSPAARGYDARWRRTRARYLIATPGCEQPGCTSLAVDVHHRDGLGPTGLSGHDDANLEALCSVHHKRITAREQPGGWAA